jgi:hypothetical protein
MTKVLTVFVAAALFALPAIAAGSSVLHPPILIQSDGVAEKIAQRYIEAQGWCDRPAPPAKPGAIVVYYARDAHGLCAARVKVGR